MADLLSHVLLVYIVLTVASWRFSAITPRWIAVAMCGGAIPDLVKVSLVLDSEVIEGLLGIPFTYNPISTLGGVMLVAGLITLAFDRRYWRRAYAFLLTGGVISLVVDGMRVYADGRAGPWLYPFTWWRPPTPSLYVTSDPTVLVATILFAVIVYGVDSGRGRSDSGPRSG